LIHIKVKNEYYIKLFLLINVATNKK